MGQGILGSLGWECDRLDVGRLPQESDVVVQIKHTPVNILALQKVIHHIFFHPREHPWGFLENIAIDDTLIHFQSRNRKTASVWYIVRIRIQTFNMQEPFLVLHSIGYRYLFADFKLRNLSYNIFFSL